MLSELYVYDFLGIFVQVITYVAVMIYLAGEKVVPALKSVRYWVSVIILSMTLALIQQFDEEYMWIGLAADFLLYALVVKINSKVMFKEAILSAVMGYMAVSVVETILLSVVMLTGMEVSVDGPGNIQTWIVFILTAPISYLAMRYLPILNFKQRIEPSGYIITMAMVLTVFALTMTMLLTNKYTFVSHISNEVIAITSIAMIVILILEEMSERRRREQLHYYETYLPIVEEMIKGVQTSQHSYNNQIMSIMGILDQDCSKEQMKSALYEITGCSPTDVRSNYQFLHLDNKLLAGLLYQKTVNAEKKGFKLDYTIRKYSFDSRLSNFDIIDITGILIDNAV